MTSLSGRRRGAAIGLALTIFLFSAAAPQASAQVTAMSLDPWQARDFLQSVDNLAIEASGHVKGTRDHEQIFLDDAYGRLRFNVDDPNAPTIGYRWLSVGFSPDHHATPRQLNDIAATVGFHLGQIGDWKFAAVLGGGFSGDNVFAGDNGYIGIGHLTAERPITPNDSLVLSLDYDGSNALLPDVPLPGFAYTHHSPTLSYALGFPASSIKWEPIEHLLLEAWYEVPYSATARIEYPLTEHIGLYSQASNLFHAFEPQHGDRTDRIFFQGARAEIGVHLIYGHFLGQYLDVAIAGGYAFDQRFSRGFDVRGLSPAQSLSDEPYVGIFIRGKL